MTTRLKNSGRPFLWAFLAAAVAGGAGIAAAQTEQSRESRQKEIASKSDAERARLQRNFKVFRDLPPAEQEKLRQLDRDLKEDARNGGNLRGLMDDYYNWLATLTPGQQQDLREIADPNRREKLVREIQKDQQEQAEASGSGRGGRPVVRLDANDFAAVLAVMEKAIREKQPPTPEQLQQLEGKQGLARQAYILRLAFSRGPGGGPAGQLQWMSPEVFDAMLEAISSEKLVKHIQEGQNPIDRRWRLFRAIHWGYRSEYEKLKPDQQALEQFFVQLKSQEQDEIMHLPFDQQPQQLLHMYMAKKSEEDPDHYPPPPQLPQWLRGQRGGARAGARPGDEQRGEAPAGRRPGAGMRKTQRDRGGSDGKTDSE